MRYLTEILLAAIVLICILLWARRQEDFTIAQVVKVLPRPLTARIEIKASGKPDGYLNFSTVKVYDSSGFNIAPYAFPFLTNTWVDGSGDYHAYYAIDEHPGMFIHSGTVHDTFSLILRAPANVKKVEIYNTRPGFADRLDGAQLSLIAPDGTTIATRTLTGDAGVQTYTF